MIVLDYYDGETSGIFAEDDECQIISRFDLLSWDNSQHWRAFCVGRVPSGAELFRRIIEFYGRFETAHWPVWAPSAVPLGKENEELKLMDELQSVRSYQFVVLSTQFHKEAAKVVPIEGKLKQLVNDFIRTGELQDFTTCKRLLDDHSDVSSIAH